MSTRACTLFSHRATYSLHDGGSHDMNLAMAGVMHPKTSGASTIWNWLSCNLGDWMTIIVSAFQGRSICELVAIKNRRSHKQVIGERLSHEFQRVRSLGEACYAALGCGCLPSDRIPRIHPRISSASSAKTLASKAAVQVPGATIKTLFGAGCRKCS